MRIIRDKMTETEKRLAAAILAGDTYLVEMLQVKLENYYKLIMIEGERFARVPHIYPEDRENFRVKPKK